MPSGSRVSEAYERAERVRHRLHRWDSALAEPLGAATLRPQEHRKCTVSP